MPIYEYVCGSCTHRFEVKQKVSDDPIAACIRCGKAVTKIISAPAIMFKGSGWYVTDYSDKLKAPASDSAVENGKKDQKPTASTSASEATPTTSTTTSAPSTSSSTGTNSSSTS